MAATVAIAPRSAISYGIDFAIAPLDRDGADHLASEQHRGNRVARDTRRHERIAEILR